MRSLVIAHLFLLFCFSSLQAELMWIWKEGKIGTQEVEFKKEFKVSRMPSKAPIMITCDNEFILHINGKKVKDSKNWEAPVMMDVKKFLKKGKNEIYVRAKNSGSMAGFLCHLDLGRSKIQSDKTWLARAPKTEWGKAVQLKTYGSAPWGKVFDQKSPVATDEKTLKLPEGFKAELLYSVPKHTEGSWVGMTVDSEGRLITCDQYGGFYRVDVLDSTKVEKLEMSISGAHGVLYAFESLYVFVNEKGKENGLYRFRDSNGDGQFDQKKVLKLFKAGGEHGLHSMVLSPDGQSIYLVMGNHSYVPDDLQESRVPRHWSEDHLLPRMWDARGHAKGKLAPGGFILKTDKDGSAYELVSMGYRNQFDAAFNLEGDLFTYDADMEWDVGSPWYRPTRVNHVVSGSEFGWRSGTGKWPEYFEDSLPATVNIGPGSPTGVCSGIGAKFPEKYQRAIYINDWTYGTMYAIHLKPEGGSYVGVKEEFVSGIPLPLTDVIIHPQDGNMYFMIGGRRTQSGLYRVSYSGSESTAPAQVQTLTPEAQLRRKLENLHMDGTGIESIDQAWPHLAHVDRFVRFAARVAIEKQPLEAWKNKALAETRPVAAIQAIMALARISKDSQLQLAMLQKLTSLDFGAMSKNQKLAALRTYQLVFTRTGEPVAGAKEKVVAELNSVFPTQDNQINLEMAKVLLYIGAPEATAKTVQLMVSVKDNHEDIAGAELLTRNTRYAAAAKAFQQSRPNKAQISLAFALHSIKTGWTPELYQTYFSWFPHAKTWKGGHSFVGFLDNFRKAALANVSDVSLKAKLEELSSKTPSSTRKITPPQGPGRNWTLSAAMKAVEGNLQGRDFERGENLFHATACATCHRFNGEGGGIGPDITGARNRYSLKDLFENIIEPSRVISDQYGSSVLTKKDGSQIIGKIGAEENGIYYVMTNPYAAEVMVEVPVKDVANKKAWPVSSMPQGLINTLSADELSDLIAYILSAGNPNEKYFSKSASLFDGKSLNGWEGDPTRWKVENGIIVGSSHGDKLKSNTFLIWKGGEVKDFELSYECKVEGANNSGMMYRASRFDPQNWRLKGNQADIHPKPEYCGMLYSEGTGRGIVAQRGTKVQVDAITGKPKVVGKTESATPVDISKWNTYKVVAIGNKVWHYVNGRLAIELEDNHKDKNLAGLLGMQLHAGAPMKAYFKNINLVQK
jgi:putative heme-binding domain-containing protein